MGRPTRGLIVVLWRAGLRISEALALAESDLEPRRGSLVVRSGKGGKMREVGMHQLRYAHPVEMARGGVPLNVIQRQLGHATLGVTSIYLQGIDSGVTIDTVRGRPAPVIPRAAALLS